MMVSGILDNDEKVIVEAAQSIADLNVKNILRLNGWLAISFSHI
jgi:ribosomal protein L11 methylase PrmA